MKKQFKISIPNPCHEDWSKMTSKEKGRFCQSCSKTVVDFTKKSKKEIQQYLSENYGKRVCGRIRREQLDTITLEIPENTFYQKLSFQKLFLLALLFVMGTTLFSCQNSNGTKQTIQNVILIDSIEEVYETGMLETDACNTKEFHIDSIQEIEEPEDIIEDVKNTNQSQDTIIYPEEIGEVEVEVLGDVEEIEESDVFIGHIIEEKARFPEAKELPLMEAQKDFNERMQLFFRKHFQAPQVQIDLKQGRYKIYTQFAIDSTGLVTDIKIRAPHNAFEKEVRRVLQKLPVFIPPTQRGKPIRSLYIFPLTVEIE
jgi:hypothetical protein